MQAIIKSKLRWNTNEIKEKQNSNLFFSFSQIEQDEITREIINLQKNKAAQSADMPIKLIKENYDIFSDFF